ncbi:ABC transporter ATP-binding protein [Facklamia sp. DSM 111018]|uniref:ABC transporter ATP-binding protein n=1 Tax=Facklamia lactis TaxID=2749967 RepID=A0ABS0LPL9_9LACT|nr:ABC transporter ATP-binding protein [Facklamia lactis]MBG9980280.1 ABC transporter ATP-binding protein [Facklamia lactis]MBG9986083.1 ABC transporter ATP-binding protein [Facklamia lactis]
MTLAIKQLNVKLNKQAILKNVSLEVSKGEYLALLGPSGSGKTTLLKTIAGLIEPSDGQVKLNGQDLSQLPPNERPISVVFQDMRLFPHYNVFENVAFSLRLKKINNNVIKQKVASLLADVQLTGYDSYPIQSLSGGQQQRVALARGLAMDPQLLLLDEPFSGLDEPLRREMGQLISALHHDKGLTTILVTHDKREAIEFADRIAFMQGGEILQIDDAEQIISQPQSSYIADFFGKANHFEGVIRQGDLYILGQKVKNFSEQIGGQVRFMVRPSRMEMFEEEIDWLDQKEIICRGRLTRLIRYPEFQEAVLEIDKSGQTVYVNLGYHQTFELKEGKSYYIKFSLIDALII